ELPLKEPIRCVRLLAGFGFNEPGNPHHDICRSWTEAAAAGLKEPRPPEAGS
ncbi:hypothetical protein, conserved, partial [Eimeria tenella]